MLKTKRLFRYVVISAAIITIGILSPIVVLADGVSFTGTSFAEQVAGAALKQLTMSRNAVYAYAANRCGASALPGTSPLYVNKRVQVTAPPPTCSIPGSAIATAETRPRLGRNNDDIVLDPTRVIAPEAAAFAWGKAGHLTRFTMDPPNPLDVRVGVMTDITLRNSFAGDPSAVVYSLTDLPPTNFDQDLSQRLLAFDFLGFENDFNNRLSQDLAAAGFSAMVPQTSFITLVAYLGPDGLQAMAIDYLGNILLTPSDFTVLTVDGVTTASFSGELSTIIRVNSGQEFNLSFEAYAGAAAPIPEPATLFLLSTSLAGVGAAVHRRRKAHKSEEVQISSATPTLNLP